MHNLYMVPFNLCIIPICEYVYIYICTIYEYLKAFPIGQTIPMASDHLHHGHRNIMVSRCFLENLPKSIQLGTFWILEIFQ